MRPEHLTVPVEGGNLSLNAWGPADAARTVLAVHGITASSQSWPAVAGALPDDWRLVAPDLRGRGHSRDLPGPSSIVRHAADVCTVAEGLQADDLVLAGHSMGAYVAVVAARSRPDLFSRLVIVDGGVPLTLPEGADPDEILAATLGPALARLAETYADADAYVDFFRRHPALAPHWDDTVEDYVRYDVLELDGPDEHGVRSRAREELVRQDGRDLLVSADEIDHALRGLTLPTHLLVAPNGMFGEPPGLLPEEAVKTYDAEVDVLSVETVPEVNHYTILFDPRAAERVAAAITAVITA